ncbi:MAG: NADH-quinone oxidoreductase subunit M [Pirellulales bacterium]
MSQLLLITIFLPLVGAVAMAALAPLGRQAVRLGALAVTVATLAMACCVVHNFPAEGASDYAATDLPWVGGGEGSIGLPEIRFSVGLDGLSLWLFGLSALLLLTSVLVSWDAVEDRPALFYSMLLLLECGCLGVFAARDLLLFYIFFEFTLIPLFFLIGIWGSEDRRYAAIKFFLFTLAGSVLTFLGLLAIVLWDSQHGGGGTLRFSIPALGEGLRSHPLPLAWQWWIFLALFAGFAIKVPLFPLHTWLPLAHVQAPTAGSVFLAGVLLKIGTYGFLRFNIPWLPDATAQCMPWMLWLAVAGIVYGALVALVQKDMKRLIAYSSVSHLGFCMLGLFALNRLGIQGGTLQMINHGLSTGGLFAIVGMLYERYHTREISQLGGLARKLPWLSFFMLVFTMSSIGLPGLNGFPGEFMILIGMFQRGFAETAGSARFSLQAVAVIAVSGVVLGAWYMLWLVQRVFFGPLREPDLHEDGQHGDGHAACSPSSHHDQAHGHHADGHHGHDHDEPQGAHVPDLRWRELAALVPLVIFVVWIGLQPDYFLRRMQTSLNPVAEAMVRPIERQWGGPERTASRAAESSLGSR